MEHKKKNPANKKICLIASSGGHYEQLLMLKALEETFDVYYVTEKTDYNGNDQNTYYIKQINRREKLFVINIVRIFFQSVKIFMKEKPDIIISTGALAVIPTFILGKAFKKKLIFIESFAKINSQTLTGKFIYKFSDVFFVQWEEMKQFYPDAIFNGPVY
ncbi:hypothetical protein UAY_02611 [Enterococcus moraviensis ATCC BAA-383]|uniref:Polysaccharide biosynthesis protein n=1 Tax=Enterococcus moraviensis ATCC BAA-383 TaxID=1158609 RepID=R2T9G3_9ENTE|nr:PssD/Cps14F family polysaccharide biosynthesis glycosyltransferase [Enterococcus moraviensis]EOH96879.1 hypothetical protein UAY_02611 [Enterococcus moraviensis ATCC BAA-383]EOT71506.1 hypothetical protein I586_01307 [Enterococcus moraviensis ATCC BAA-383]OJG68559.1 hypothetical protein RV09_GL001806 [Enterococcus moraviensis]